MVLTFLLAFAGFATGSVIARRANRSRAAHPVHPVEVLIVAVALVAIGVLRPAQHGAAYALVCAVVMVVVGMLSARAAGAAKRVALAGTREFEPARTHDEAPTVWKRYMSFSRSVVDFEFRVLLVTMYLLFVAPIALGRRLGRGSAPEQRDSNWLARNETPPSESARSAF